MQKIDEYIYDKIDFLNSLKAYLHKTNFYEKKNLINDMIISGVIFVNKIKVSFRESVFN